MGTFENFWKLWELMGTLGTFENFGERWKLWGTSRTVANFGLELWVEWNFPVPTAKFQPEVPKRSQIFQSSQSSLATFTNKLEKNGKNDMEDTDNMLKW